MITLWPFDRSTKHNTHDLWFVWINNLGKILCYGVFKREGKSGSAKKSPFTHDFEKSGTPPYKKIQREERKESGMKKDFE